MYEYEVDIPIPIHNDDTLIYAYHTYIDEFDTMKIQKAIWKSISNY